jgi:hypothetical protein
VQTAACRSRCSCGIAGSDRSHGTAPQNAGKYAQASQARIALQAQNGTLRFTVSDDGTGYGTSHILIGSGLRNMADRLAALGGRLEVSSTPAKAPPSPGTSPSPSPAAVRHALCSAPGCR